MLESEELTETKIFDEIQGIKNMLKGDSPYLENVRKRSINFSS